MKDYGTRGNSLKDNLNFMGNSIRRSSASHNNSKGIPISQQPDVLHSQQANLKITSKT